MASRALLKKKKGSGDPVKQLEDGLSTPDGYRRQTERKERCPTFWVQYLGKMPAKGEFGKEYISEPVEALCKMREKQRLPKTALTISGKGFHFMDCHGPFGKEKHVIIPIHHVCYGIADAQYPRVFAIITRSDSDPESSLFECHAFLCEKRKTAQLITYWLLKTFLQVFENLQRKRYHRKKRERRKLESQMQLNSSGSETNSSTSSAPRPSQQNSEYVYSVILEGSKDQGASVRISRDLMTSGVSGRRTRLPNYLASPRGGASAMPDMTPNFQPPVHPTAAQASSTVKPSPPQNFADRSLRYAEGASAAAEVDEINNPRYFKFRKKSQPRTPIYERHFSMDNDAMTTFSSTSSGSGTFSESSWTGSSFSGNSSGSDKDFLYIKMLQDGISSIGVDDEETNKTSKQIAQDLGLPTRLTDKDINVRIQEWLRLTLRDEKEDESEGYCGPTEPEISGVASRGDYF